MSKSLEQVRSFLNASGILSGATSAETCMVVVPTRRLRSGRIALLLQMNGIRLRALGHGTGKVRNAYGAEQKVRGLLVLAVDSRDVRRVELYARLYGALAVRIDAKAEK